MKTRKQENKKTRKQEIQDQAYQFHMQHPDIWLLFIKYTNELINRGFRHYSAKGIFERIRWHTDKPNHEGKSTFKLNNNYTAIYARMFHACYPEHAGFFRTRHQISEKAPATGLPEFSPEKIKSCN